MIVHYIVSFVCGVLFVILLAIASGGHASPIMMEKLQHSGLVNFVFALLGSFAYHMVFTTLHGSTVGKIALSMVVVQEEGSPCKFKGALIRSSAIS